MKFEEYPFEKLNYLLGSTIVENFYPISDLTLGEPRFSSPEFIQKEFREASNLLNKYPKSSSEEYLVSSIKRFVSYRFGIELSSENLLPVFGTREALFNFPQFLLFDEINPTVAFTNPFYQIYEGAAIASGSRIIYLDLKKENNFLPSININELRKSHLVILNFPNNPTGAVMDIDTLKRWVEYSIKEKFVLINDECYSEIYMDEGLKPPSLLQACHELGNHSFSNCLVLNSISKRSSSPGLRSGFIAGDKRILADYKRYRTYLGCASPLPLQKAAAKAWNEESHVRHFRNLYRKNIKLAKEILGVPIPKATFYIWLYVEDDIAFTKKLYQEMNIKVLPGTYLGRNGAGVGYVRIALVEEYEKMRETLLRLKKFMETYL